MTRAGFVAALGLISLTVPLRAQGGPSPAAPSRDTVLAASREIMANARFCTFITVGLDGHPQARVVDPFAPEDEMTVWLATKPTTRKVAQIRADPRVTLRVRVDRLEIVSGRHGLRNDPKMWRPVILDFR